MDWAEGSRGAGTGSRSAKWKLRWCRAGLSDKEIGFKLFMSESTVKSHLRTNSYKLKLRNRAQAAAFAVEKGLIPPSLSALKPPRRVG